MLNLYYNYETMTQEEMKNIIKRANENSTRQYELGYEKAKEELIEKACKWLEYNFNMPSDFKEHFTKAMMEE